MKLKERNEVPNNIQRAHSLLKMYYMSHVHVSDNLENILPHRAHATKNANTA